MALKSNRFPLFKVDLRSEIASCVRIPHSINNLERSFLTGPRRQPPPRAGKRGRKPRGAGAVKEVGSDGAETEGARRCQER